MINDENKALVLRDNAREQLMQIKDIESGVEYLNKIKAIEVWAKAEKKDAELQNIIAEQKLRTQRILGGLIKIGQEAGELITPKDTLKQNTVVSNENNGKKLSDIGISRKQSSTFQQIAEIPDNIFETAIAEKKEAVNKAVSELTTTGMLQVAKELKREDAIKNKVHVFREMPTDKFNIIYADPPYRYEFSETNTRQVENQYPTMELEDIKKLEVPSADNSVLLLWSPPPKLREALDIMEAWGFTYRTSAVWDKVIIGMGYWLRSQHELLLLGIKGEFQPPIPANRFSSVYSEKRERHSKKPDYYYKMIEQMFPTDKYLEVFARQKYNEKWEIYGNE